MSEETSPIGKIVGAIQDAKNVVVDSIEKVSSPANRAGHTVERVGKLVEGGVDKEVIALQMTKRSPTKKVYTEAAVDVLSDVYQDSKTTVLAGSHLQQLVPQPAAAGTRRTRPLRSSVASMGSSAETELSRPIAMSARLARRRSRR